MREKKGNERERQEEKETRKEGEKERERGDTFSWIERLERGVEKKSMRERESKAKAREEREKKKWNERDLHVCMSQELFLSDSLRRFGEGSSMFFVILCGDVVRKLFARSVEADMKCVGSSEGVGVRKRVRKRERD